jgi:hypothetical protein
MLQPLRSRLDTEPSPRHPICLSDLRTTITAVVAAREPRSLSFACFAFNGTQAVPLASRRRVVLEQYSLDAIAFKLSRTAI